MFAENIYYFFTNFLEANTVNTAPKNKQPIPKPTKIITFPISKKSFITLCLPLNIYIIISKKRAITKLNK